VSSISFLYVAYHVNMALEEGRITAQEAKRLAGYMVMRSVGAPQGDRTTEWRYRNLASRVGLLRAFDDLLAAGERRAARMNRQA